MTDPVTCVVCGYTCKNHLVAYCGYPQYINVNISVVNGTKLKTPKTVTICQECAKKIALKYVEEA